MDQPYCILDRTDWVDREQAEAAALSLHRTFRAGLWGLALCRWELGAALGLTMVLLAGLRLPVVAIPTPVWSWLAVVCLGIAGSIWLVWATLSDACSHDRVVHRILLADLNLDAFREDALRSRLAMGIELSRRIVAPRMGIRGPHGCNRSRFLDGAALSTYPSTGPIDGRVELLDRLRQKNAERLGALRATSVHETDARTLRDIADTIAKYRNSITLADKIVRAVERAGLKIEQSLALLGTIHAQLLLAGAIGLESAATERILSEITDHARDLAAAVAATERFVRSNDDEAHI